MSRHLSRACWPLLCLAVSVIAVGLVHGENPGQHTGRFLFAGDDDWDWASPLGAEKPSKLARYGAMPWSALDWAEAGLPKVRGVLVGTPPNAKKTISMEELSNLRGEKATYQHHNHAGGLIKRLLAKEDAPNVIILMQNTAKGHGPGGEEIKTLVDFVNHGGRLVVLDDWKKYGAVLDAFVGEALKLPPGPPIPEPPDPEPAAVEEEDPKPSEPIEPHSKSIDPDVEKQFDELVPQLGDESFKVRDAASKSLLALGDSILPLLNDVETDDPEIANRLAELDKKLAPPPRSDAKAKALQSARRKAKYKLSVERAHAAARKLRDAKIPHQLTNVMVDAEKRPLPTLRLSFPAAR